MNKRFIAIIVLGISFSVFLLMKPWRNHEITAAEPESTSIEAAWEKKSPGARPAVPGQPPLKNASAPIAVSPEITKDCREFWQDLRALDLAKTSLFEKGPEAFPDPARCKQLPPSFDMAQKVFNEKCRQKFDPKQKLAREHDCKVAAFTYRAMTTEYLTRTTSPKDIDDPRILTDKLYAQFATQPASALEVAERLRELEPDNYPALQATIFSRLSIAMNPNNEGKLDDKFYSDLRAELTRAQSLNETNKYNDWQLKEAEILVSYRERNNPEVVHEKAQALSQSDPKSGLGPYYLSWHAFKTGNPEEGQKYLAEAIRREPNNPRYQSAGAFLKKVPDFYTDPTKKGTPFISNFFTQLMVSPDVN
jgi:hypothetical protein